jgi:hypothetical protein
MEKVFYFKISAIIILLVFVFFVPSVVFGQASSSLNVNLEVTGTCNNNNICEFDLGETDVNCFNDCGCNNNGLCETDREENIQNCPSDCVTPTPENVGGSSLYFGDRITNINSNVGFNSAAISWQTERSALCSFYWGLTAEYEREIIFETGSKTSHFVGLSGLDVSTVYHFKITCSDDFNPKVDSQDQQFKTLNIVNNVSNFKATGSDKKITLAWDNPSDSMFGGVKIFKSDLFFPLNQAQGNVIYEGLGSGFEDISVENLKIYYYTIFVFDKDNNYSSGAVTFAAPYKNLPQPGLENPTSPVAENLSENQPQAVSLTIKDFIFLSDGKTIEVKNDKTIEVYKGSSLTVSIDCQKLEGIKTVLIQLLGRQDVSSFILKQENENNFCNASIITPEDYGVYPIKILLINFKNETIGQIDAEVKVLARSQNPVWFLSLIAFKIYILIILLIILLILFLIWFLFKRRKKEEKEKTHVQEF